MYWALNRKIRKLIEEDRTDEAAAMLRSLVRRSRLPSSHHLNYLGVCESRLGHFATAHEMFTQALLLSPRDARSLNNLGNLAFIEKQLDAARDYYMRALRENVWAVEPRYNLTVLYQDTGHSEKALSAFQGYMTVKKALLWAKLAGASLLVLLLVLLLKF